MRLFNSRRHLKSAAAACQAQAQAQSQSAGTESCEPDVVVTAEPGGASEEALDVVSPV